MWCHLYVGQGWNDHVDVLTDLFPRTVFAKVDATHEVDDRLAKSCFGLGQIENLTFAALEAMSGRDQIFFCRDRSTNRDRLAVTWSAGDRARCGCLRLFDHLFVLLAARKDLAQFADKTNSFFNRFFHDVLHPSRSFL